MSKKREGLQMVKHLTTITFEFLRQKAKTEFYTQGDECTRYFFARIKAKKAVNSIVQLNSRQGQLLTEKDSIQAEEFLQRAVGKEGSN